MPADDLTDRSDGTQASVQGAPVTVGRALRSARKERRLSLEQVAAELRMEAPLLQALEEDRFEALGAPVFVKGYLKHYGHRLGLDAERLLTMYYEQVGSQEPPMVPRRSIDLDETPPVSGRLIAGAVVVVVAAAGVWWLYAGGMDGSSARQGSEASSPATLDAPASGAGAEAPAAARRSSAPGASGSVSAVAEPTNGGSDRSAEPAGAVGPENPAAAAATDTAAQPPAAALQSPAIEAPEGVVSAAPFDGAAESIEQRAAGDDDAEPAPPPQDLVAIEVTLADDCWTEVTDARGERLYYGLAAAGESLRLEGQAPVSFLFGNAPAVSLSIGGEPYPVPLQGRQGDLARFTVSR